MSKTQLVCSIVAALLCFAGERTVARADESLPEKPIGRFVTLKPPIDDSTVSLVHNTVAELTAQSERENRSAVLVLEIQSGSSRFGQVRDIASFLTSSDASRVRTVAWIPESVDGNHTVLALACHEIMMHPDATLGDIGRGQAPEEADQAFLFSLVDRRRNVRLSRGIVQSMISSAQALKKVTLVDESGRDVQRFLTVDELRLLQEQGQEITNVETIREAGAAPVFHGSDSEKAGFLVSKTASSRSELIERLGLPRDSMRERRPDARQVVRVIEIHNVISGGLQDFVQREIRNATASGATLLIFDIDSPGGELTASQQICLSIADLDPEKVTTVAWVSRGAWSGAALIAFGCDQILMHPDAQIGDIGVIKETESGGAFERAPEKIVSPFLEFAAAIAKRKHRAPGLLQAMIDRDLEVFEVTSAKDGTVSWMTEHELQAQPDEWVKGPMVPESRKGVLLTVRGQRAVELRLAEAVCRDFADVRTQLAIPEDQALVPVKRTWVDGLVTFLNSGFGGFLLLTVAIICLYVEVHAPTGLFAIPSVVCFALFFWSRFLGGTAGSLELIVFCLGLGLLALELFVIPGFGVFGVSGILLTFASLIMASHTYAGMTATEGFEQSMGSLGSLTAALVTVIATAVVLNRFLPSIPWINRLILTPPGHVADEDGPRLNPLLTSGTRVVVELEPGARGVAASALRPSGKAVFGDKYLDVVSDGAFVDHGAAVEVIRVAGNRVIVRPVPVGSAQDSRPEASAEV